MREVSSSCNQQIARAHAQLLHELRQLELFSAVQAALAAQDAAPRHAPQAAQAVPAEDTCTVGAQGARQEARNSMQPGQAGGAAAPDQRHSNSGCASGISSPVGHMGFAVGSATVATPQAAPAASLHEASTSPLGSDAVSGGAVQQQSVPCSGASAGAGSSEQGCGCAPAGKKARECLRTELCTVFMLLCRSTIARFHAQAERASLLPQDALKRIEEAQRLLHCGNSSLVEDEVVYLERQLGKLGVLDGGEGGSDALSSSDFPWRCSCDDC